MLDIIDKLCIELTNVIHNSTLEDNKIDEIMESAKNDSSRGEEYFNTVYYKNNEECNIYHKFFTFFRVTTIMGKNKSPLDNEKNIIVVNKILRDKWNEMKRMVKVGVCLCIFHITCTALFLSQMV